MSAWIAARTVLRLSFRPSAILVSMTLSPGMKRPLRMACTIASLARLCRLSRLIADRAVGSVRTGESAMECMRDFAKTEFYISPVNIGMLTVDSEQSYDQNQAWRTGRGPAFRRFTTLIKGKTCRALYRLAGRSRGQCWPVVSWRARRLQRWLPTTLSRFRTR